MQFLETLLPAHFTRLNRNIFFLSILFSIASFVALLNVSPKDEDTARQLLATLVDEEQFVTRKYANSLSFNEINKGEKLYNGDTIVTGDRSLAKIVFLKSKNVLNIPQKGLVKIEEGESGENIEIQRGLAEFIIQKDQKINIIQGTEKLVLTSNSTSEGSGKLFYKNNKLIVKVESGQININDAKGVIQNIKKDETISVSVAEKIVTKIVTTLLTSPIDEQKIDIWNGINLAWGFNGPIEATLSKTRDFSEVVSKINPQSSPYNWNPPLEIGRYYLKVKAMDPKAKEEPPIALTMVAGQNISNFVPENNATVNLKRGEPLRFSWSAVPVEKYRVNVETSNGQKTSYITSKPELSLADFKDTKLSWTVSPLLKSGIYLESLDKKLININFEGENKILRPLPGQKFRFGKDKILLSWTSLPKENVHLKISGSESKIILEKDLQINELDFVAKDPGNYTLELSSIDYPSIPPAIVNFTVQSIAAEWTSKENIFLSSVDPEEKKIEMNFNTKASLSELELVIFGDEGLKKKLRSGRVLSKTITYPVKEFGTYCLVLQAAEKDSPWLPGDSRCIVYSSKKAFDLVATPKNLVMKFIELNGVASYSFEVPAVPRADVYEVQVFKDQLAKSLVYTERSKNNNIKWPSKKAGVFYYRYRVFDTKQRVSDYSGTAKLVFPISPLSDWQE
jgi:hypothetical protein